MPWVEKRAGRADVWSGTDATSYKLHYAVLSLGRGKEGMVLCLPTLPCRSYDTYGAFQLASHPLGGIQLTCFSILACLTSISGERNGRAYWSGLKALLCSSLDSFPLWFVCMHRQVPLFAFKVDGFMFLTAICLSKVSQERWLAWQSRKKEILNIIISITDKWSRKRVMDSTFLLRNFM